LDSLILLTIMNASGLSKKTVTRIVIPDFLKIKNVGNVKIVYNFILSQQKFKQQSFSHFEPALHHLPSQFQE